MYRYWPKRHRVKLTKKQKIESVISGVACTFLVLVFDMNILPALIIGGIVPIIWNLFNKITNR